MPTALTQPNPTVTTARRLGILFLVSAPSGAGKSTLRDNLRKTGGFHYSVSCTTRAPRPGEVDGVDYHYVDFETFARRRERGDFLEWAEVHGNFYGTLRADVISLIEAGMDLLLDIDVQGARQVRTCGDPQIVAALVDIFIMPPNLAELKKRLAGRGTESEDQLALRLANARREMQGWQDYRYVILSGSREEDHQRFQSIMIAERLATSRLLDDPMSPAEVAET